MAIEKSSTVTPIAKPIFTITDLPFVKQIKKPSSRRHFWSVTPSGDYRKDCQLGEYYARLTLEYIQNDEFPPVLGWIVADMPEKLSGIEFGFFSVIAIRAAFPFTAQRRAA